jgi:hypothetical protein
MPKMLRMFHDIPLTQARKPGCNNQKGGMWSSALR